jgi:hypothetical protein
MASMSFQGFGGTDMVLLPKTEPHKEQDNATVSDPI